MVLLKKKKKTALGVDTDRDRCVFIRLWAKPSIKGYDLATHQERRTVLGADNYSNNHHYSVMSLCPQLPGRRPLVFAKVLLKAEHVLKSLLGKQHFSRAKTESLRFALAPGFFFCFLFFFFCFLFFFVCFFKRFCVFVRTCVSSMCAYVYTMHSWVCARGERNTGWGWGVEEKPTEASVLN